MSTATMDRPVSSDQRPKSMDLFRNLGTVELYRHASDRQMTVSAYLEEQDPSFDYKDGLDAFERLLLCARIRTQSDPAGSYYASELDAFNKDANTRALFPEWAARTWRKVTRVGRMGGQRDLMTIDASTIGGVMRPYVDSAQAQYQQIMPSLPLQELVARMQPIRGNRARAFYFSESAAGRRMTRVVEATEIPPIKITGSDRDIPLYKYGRRIETSYELLRQEMIDQVAFWIMRAAIQSEIDKVAAVIDVIVNGDGNSGTAAPVYNLTTLDPTTSANNMTLAAWLAFKLKFPNPYVLTHIVGQEAMLLKAMLINTGTANVPLVNVQAQLGFGGFTQINPQLGDNVRVGLSADAPANQLVGIDGRFAIVEYSEIGADIAETVRWVERQATALVMSETIGFQTQDANAVAVLNVAA